MFVKIDSSSNIVECIYGGKEEPGYTIDQVLNGEAMFESPILKMENGRFEYLALPINYREDIYVYDDGQYKYLSTDFFRLVGMSGDDQIDQDRIDVFRKKAYVKKPYTWSKHVQVLSCHSVYTMDARGEFVCHPINNPGGKDTYEYYKEHLSSTFDYYLQLYESEATKKHALLLSGGADSRLLALLLKEKKVDFKAYVGRIMPYSFENLNDVEKAARVCKQLGVELEIVDIDESKEEFSEQFKEMIMLMPDCMHGCILHLAVMKKIREDGCGIIWCGQNADSLYNCGATERMELTFHGLLNAYKRFCFSELYLKSFRQVKGYSFIYKLIDTPIAAIGAMVYGKLKKTHVSMPKTIEEFLHNVSEAYDYTCFTHVPYAGEDAGKGQYTAREIKELMLSDKIRNYLRGGDARVVLNSAHVFGMDFVALLYSSENMLSFYRSMKYGFRSILRPKEFTYKYIREMSRKYGRSIADFSSCNRSELLDKYKDIQSIQQRAKQRVSLGNADAQDSGKTGLEIARYREADVWISQVQRYMADAVKQNN